MNYTSLSDTTNKEIVFLNDNNIVSTLTGSVDYNGIPSYELFKDTYDILSSEDTHLCSIIDINKGIFDTLSVKANILCGELSTAISANDKDIAYLSIEISANDNDIQYLSSEISSNDNDIKYLSSEISSNDVDIANILSTYVKTTDFKTSLISNDASFLISSDFTKFTYVEHCIVANIGGNELSINTADFEKGRFISDVMIANCTDQSNVYAYDKMCLAIIFKLEDGTQNTVWIPITEFAPLYIAGNGLSISQDLTITIKDDIARVADMKHEIALSVNALDYSKTLLVGKFDSITQTDGLITATSTYITSADFGINKLAESQIENLPGDLFTLSHDVSSLQMSEVYDLKFFAPVIVASDVGTPTIKSFFTTHHLNIDGGNTVKNGSIYNIILSDDYSLTDVVTIGTAGSELKLGNGDWLVVRDSYNTPFVSLDALSTVGENANLYVIKAGTSVYEIYALSTALSNEVDNLSTALNTEIQTLSTSLSNTVDSQTEFLSNAISSKIYVDDQVNNDLCGYSDLSIVKVTKETFENQIISDTMLCANTLYIVQSDDVDMYGQLVRNVAEPLLSGDAATKNYVDSQDTILKSTIKTALTTISNVNLTGDQTVATLSAEVVKIRNILSTLNSVL